MIQFKDSDGNVTKIDNPPSTGVKRAKSVSDEKLTEDASTEGICGSITDLDVALKSLEDKLENLKSVAAGLANTSCSADSCNVPASLRAFSAATVDTITETLTVLEYTRALYGFMKPDNMKFTDGTKKKVIK